MKLLNLDHNAKTVKGRRLGFVTAILYLSPSDTSGVEYCPMARLADCRADCLNTAGRGGMAKGNATMIAPNSNRIPDNAVRRARLARSALFNTDREAFMARLVRELEYAKVYARRKRRKLVVRLNGTSDIRWESISVTRRGILYPHIFAAFPKLQFYDYTKLPNRRVSGIRNYHLTFSYSHSPEFSPYVLKALDYYGAAVNFAVVFRGPAPRYFLGRTVVDGDDSDLRFLDSPGVVVALRAKGRARRSSSQFIVH